MVDVHGDELALRYLAVLGDARENYNHRAAAALARTGKLRHIVTLNFDVLFEQALRDCDVSFNWNLPLASDIPIGDLRAQVVVTKPHGTLPLSGMPYETHYLASTLQYSGDRPQRETAKVLDSISRESPVLLVAGYRDEDWDISPLLMSAQWSRVYWCEFITYDKLPDCSFKYPCPPIRNWLDRLGQGNAYVLVGDVRALLASLLGEQIDIGADDRPFRIPDASMFLRKRERTALAAVHCLDGVKNQLYKALLPQLESPILAVHDEKLHRSWQRTFSWFNHVYKRRIRRSVYMHNQLINSARLESIEDRLQYVHDLKSLYYEYISAAKRPYLNFRWPLDLVRAHKIENQISCEVQQIRAEDKTNPWILKEAERQLAFVAYYRIDLLHNWGYHLLVFTNGPTCMLIRSVFRKISAMYEHVASKYPVLDWEYHYVRRIEASIIAKNSFDRDSARRKLNEISAMFKNTGSQGHRAYTESVIALLDENEEDFERIERQFIQDDSLATPTALLRMCLFRRYSWPATISWFSAFRNLLRYSSDQR